MSEIHKTAPDSEKAFRKDLENAIVYLDQISSNLTHSTSLLIQSLFLKSQKIQSQISQKKFFYTSMLEYLSLPISSHIESFLSNHDFSHGSSLFTDISEAQKKIEDFFETEIFSDIKNVWQDEYLIFSDRNSNIKKVDLLSLQMNKLEYFNGFIAGGCQGCKVSEDLYFINGGIDEQRQSYNNSYMIDIANEKTIEYPDSIGKRFVAACVCKDDKVYIFGGFSNF